MSVVSTQSIDPGMVTAASGSIPAPTLYGWDGKPLSQADLRSPIDFGPGVPLAPRIPLPDVQPREHQYPIGFNLVTTPRVESGKRYSFAQLRAWADACPYFRLAVEYRKKQIRSLEWSVVPIEDPKSPAARRKHQPDIERAEAFIRQPNRVDGMRLSTWLGQALEECLVTDALVFHKQRNRKGDLHSLVQIDGATIKPLIDQWGHVVGYQQILYGYPATQYRRGMTDEDGEVYGPDELVSWVYAPRVDSVYGTSPLEEILPTVLTAIKRAQTQLAWYTDGTVPDAFLEAPEKWGPEQIKLYQEWLDLTLAGDDAKRRRLRVVPGGSTYTQAKPFAFSRDEEEAIASLVLAHMGVPKMLLVSQVNRATAETQQADAVDTGARPLIYFLEEHLSEIIQTELGLGELRVICSSSLGSQSGEKAKQDAILVQAGIMTPDEVRADRGLDPLVDESAESEAATIDPSLIQRAFLEAGVITRDELRATIGLPPAKEGGDQYVTIGAFGITAPDAVADAAEAPKTPPALAPFAGKEPKDALPPNAGALAGGDGSGAAGAAGDVASGDGGDDDEPDEDESAAAKAERSEWRRFAVKRWSRGRRHTAPFEAKSLAPVEAARIRKALAAAKSEDDVVEAFGKAKKLTPALKQRAEGQIKSAARRWFEAEYKAAKRRGEELLAGNANA